MNFFLPICFALFLKTLSRAINRRMLDLGWVIFVAAFGKKPVPDD
jgi:hypothetical protein